MDDSLTSFIDEICGDSHLRVEDDLGDGYVRLRSSEAQRRQAKHDIRCTEDIIIELLRNARDAGARNIFLALSREGEQRFISIIDDGAGIPEAMQGKIFEPRVTSKLDSMHVDTWGVHGRGMALYSISVNAIHACVVASGKDKGAAFLIETNLKSLPEKTDQSSLPIFTFNDEGALVVRGPHNINRIVAEFAFEHRELCEVYLGSPTEIAATIFEYGNATLTKSMRTFCDNPEELSLIKRLGTAASPSHFVTLATQMGLDISERSARRIMDGEIAVLSPFIESVTIDEADSGEKRKKRDKDMHKLLARDARGLKVHPDDLDEFAENIQRAYKDLAKRYYLDENMKPELALSKEAISIKIPLNKLS
ncbi:MAG: ATP-binding protein [Eggerthellaceae bacterium]|nr:ATP-binding protein [Eggerthellaceae bacterium]